MKQLAKLWAPSPRSGPVDVVLAAIVIALLGFGVVMVYSSSVIEATEVFRDPQYFLKRQAVYAGLGMVVMFAMSRFDYHKLRAFTYPILAGVTVLLVLSIVGFGHTGGGATRWLKLGPVNLQPSELAKVGLVLWLAYSLDKKGEKVKSFSVGMLPHVIISGMLVLLCLKQPDFGGAVVLLFLTFTMLFVAGARFEFLLGGAIIGSLGAYVLVRFKEYRWERMVAWLNMSEHRQDLAYQPFQSVMSFGSGELTGLGLGKGLQVLYLPEAHTDFISAIIGEELGFIGILALAGVYLWIVIRGVRAALSAEDDYGSFVAFGLSVLFGVQALVNMGVAMSVLPTKGLTLPFVSYGGSSLMANAVAMGILLNISRSRAPATNARRAGAGSGPEPEASAVLVTEAAFAPERPRKQAKRAGEPEPNVSVPEGA
ncbi:MAG: putative lipid II flippase FtsW [Sorangiineae bacterium]|nr:putative lipid II flippase FtsW [Polyangiaceae bacterium]MEB2322742.1 putative lipid II flippase FtsW [Sorangiineae bacterium]